MGQAQQQGPVVEGLWIEGVGRHNLITAGDGTIELVDGHGIETGARIGNLGLGRRRGSAGREQSWQQPTDQEG
jgi:hypothetical protein